MDTDSLSNETYEGILLTVDKYYPDLTSYFGAIASECNTEDDFLLKVLKEINVIMNADLDELDEIFYGVIPTKENLDFFTGKLESQIT